MNNSDGTMGLRSRQITCMACVNSPLLALYCIVTKPTARSGVFRSSYLYFASTSGQHIAGNQMATAVCETGLVNGFRPLQLLSAADFKPILSITGALCKLRRNSDSSDHDNCCFTSSPLYMTHLQPSYPSNGSTSLIEILYNYRIIIVITLKL